MLGILQYLNHFAIASGCDPNKTFFGIPVWYKYLDVSAGSGACSFENFKIWPPDSLILIALAVFDAMLRIAGLACVVIVLYGGAQYVFSQGEPEKTKGALTTIINGCIGLAVALIAVPAIAFIGNRMGG